jgi:hypothetical protein
LKASFFGWKANFFIARQGREGIGGEAQEIMAEGLQGFIQKPYRLDARSRKMAALIQAVWKTGWGGFSTHPYGLSK